jgi:MFS superfamily sulfate permease-like transporter
MESVSAGRAFAAKYGYKLDVRQELLGIGSANLLVAFGQGYPVAGGLSQSAVNEQAGAKTPLSLIFASLTLALCLLFFTGFLLDLPKAVLAAIVLMAVKGLINFREIGHLWRVSRLEFTVATVALDLATRFGVLLPSPPYCGERSGLMVRFVPIALPPDGNSNNPQPRRCCSGYLRDHGLQ